MKQAAHGRPVSYLRWILVTSCGRLAVRREHAGSTHVNVVVADLDIVTVAYAGILALRDRHVLAIVTPHHDAPGGATGIAALADLVAHHAAGDGAAHGCRLAAVALADRVAQQATRHGTNDGAQGAAAATVAVEVNLLHFLHHATVGAAGGAVLAGLPVATIVAATV